MEITKTAKQLGTKIEKGAELVINKVADAFDNLASHIPFSNLAKKENSIFHIDVDLPGVDKKDVNIYVEDNVLIVNAIRHYKNELSRDDYYLCESSFGKFERRYTLPENIDKDKIDAKFDDGRLSIELHKTESSKMRAIAIK
ncbi:MAG: Hsp20/alpha crystallin family protein [Sulfurimonas sp.]|nr:Hsp20/alpha crystallin family protein [Sulfurimonas sp.]